MYIIFIHKYASVSLSIYVSLYLFFYLSLSALPSTSVSQALAEAAFNPSLDNEESAH